MTELRPFLLILLWICYSCGKSAPETQSCDVLIIGGGASGTAAAIHSARLGAKTILIEETPWLGGMLTSAGVSAIDGNYKLESGFWHEFRNEIFNHYGGADSVKTGWVSNVLFEPSVAEAILTKLTDSEDNLRVYRNTVLKLIRQKENRWHTTLKGELEKIDATIIIDATELGDVAKKAGIKYDVGMDARKKSLELIAPKKANNIIQDLTYVAILKDYGNGADMTIKPPKNYNPSTFYCSCDNNTCEQDSINRTLWACDKMLEYGKLPNDKYIINWPIFGNDFYTNTIDLPRAKREEAYEKAKDFTRGFIYYIQTELGYKNLGLADDEFPTDDLFPFIPYHRESRRIHGKVRFTLNHLAKPYDYNYFRTGIAVGDYAVDHHHAAYPDQTKVPDLHFYPVPSYTIPMGCLLPEKHSNFIVAEKSISVSNIVNGTTRLQPVCLLIGQAAGTMAALAIKNNCATEEVSVREVQQSLLDAKTYLIPYLDITPDHKQFRTIQKIGVTGIIKAELRNAGWENQTWFRPDSLITSEELKKGIAPYLSLTLDHDPQDLLTVQDVVKVIHYWRRKLDLPEVNTSDILEILDKLHGKIITKDSQITRLQLAILFDQYINPFERYPIDIYGEIKK
ncbi:FAD-dependent oxidoreductase [Puteibacter caeruleilacunae]|nr:FAD-dependent oxidoreductase [Puteibacter caeruleilacunae]